MRIPFSVVFALLLSLDTFAAPVPNAQVGDEFALEVRKAKVAAKKPVKAPVKAKPVAKKPVAKPAAKKPVAKPAAKKPVAKPAAKKPVAKPAAKKPAAKPAAAKKPVAKPAAKKPAAKPAAKKPVAAKKPATAAKKPATTAKKPTTAAKKPTTAAKKPATAAKKPATAAKKPTTAAKKPTTAAKKPAAPAKKPTTAAPAKKPPTKSAAKPAASAKPSKLPKCTPAQIEAREFEDLETRELELELEARASVSHPSGTGSITLFHGTTAASAASLASSGVDLSKTRGTGDFNHKPEVAGGFYLTDSLVAAAQFACYGIPGKKPASVDVVEFKWSGSGKQVHTFPGETADWLAFQQFNQNPNEVVVTTGPFAAKAAELFKNDMIEGPLNGPADVLITDDFQQYAVIKQDAATNNLRFSKRHQNILCKNVPTGNKLTAKLYQQGQAGNAKFNSRLTKLQNAKLLSGTCVIQ